MCCERLRRRSLLFEGKEEGIESAEDSKDTTSLDGSEVFLVFCVSFIIFFLFFTEQPEFFFFPLYSMQLSSVEINN